MKAKGRYRYFSAWAKLPGGLRLDVIVPALSPLMEEQGGVWASSAVACSLLPGTWLMYFLHWLFSSIFQGNLVDSGFLLAVPSPGAFYQAVQYYHMRTQ